MKALIPSRALVVEIICMLLILLFIYAALSKLMDVEKFRAQIGQSPMLTSFADWVAVGIPLSEIVISLMLMMPRLRIFGLYASLSLMVMFTAYIVAITQYSVFVPCSCGGVLEKLGWTEHLIFNIGIVLMAVAGITLHSKQENNELAGA